MSGSVPLLSRLAGGLRLPADFGLSSQLDTSASVLTSTRSLVGDIAGRIGDLLFTLLRGRFLTTRVDLKIGVGCPLALDLLKLGLLLVLCDDCVVVERLSAEDDCQRTERDEHISHRTRELLADERSREPPDERAHQRTLER
jgi:hypothetical protein